MKIVAVRQVVSIGFIIMVLVGYGSNDNRLRIWERVEWMVCHSDRKHLYQRPLPAIHQLSVFE